MAGPWGAPGGTLKGNGGTLLNASQRAPGGGEGARPRPPWLACMLAAILIFTIAVDVLGNLLVILSVYRNKKLRNAGRGPGGARGLDLHPMAACPPFWPLSGSQPPVPPSSTVHSLFLKNFIFSYKLRLGVSFSQQTQKSVT